MYFWSDLILRKLSEHLWSISIMFCKFPITALTSQLFPTISGQFSKIRAFPIIFWIFQKISGNSFEHTPNTQTLPPSIQLTVQNCHEGQENIAKTTWRILQNMQRPCRFVHDQPYPICMKFQYLSKFEKKLILLSGNCHDRYLSLPGLRSNLPVILSRTCRIYI